MDTRLHAVNDARTSFYFERSRLNDLLMEAVRCPVIMVCAGAGYGKTSAVHDFTNMYEADTSWMQLSELDNTGVRFWENFIHTMAKLTEPFARAIGKTGFPDTIDKLNSYQILLHKYIDAKRRILVMDDFYLVKDPSVLRFIEYISNNMPVGVTLILISRSIPGINTANLTSKGLVFNINEDDLRFNENELAQYFHQFDISVPPDGLYEIMQDTEGWAFAINMIARSYQKAPGYNGYLRSAMKSNIFAVMETETWNGISERLQKFLVCLSLISHLSIDLIELLAKGDEELLAELERQNAYIRRDGYINAYLIHPLLLEFLAAKQDLLSGKQKRETYTIAGQWCNRNGFRIDALTYYEKTGNYEKIVSIINEFPYQLPYDIAKFTETILERAPAQAFNEVEDLAVIHIRACMGQGLMQKTIKLAEYYEKKFLGMPGNDAFKRLTLGGIYYNWGMVRILLSITDDRYDFVHYFKKFTDYVSGLDCKVTLPGHSPGPWIVYAGSSRKDAPEDFITAHKNIIALMSAHFNGRLAGEDDLALGEYKFYQGDTRNAEISVNNAIELARENRQFVIIHRALLYLMRIAIAQGNYIKADQAVKDMKPYLAENEFVDRFINYDIAQCWYYCALDRPDETPDWLKENFSPYAYCTYIENFANQAKARYCYKTRNYLPLLSYIGEMKQRESSLFGRVEMLAIEACVHCRMKDAKKARSALKDAYETAMPNGIVMPFIELGRDMRTLSASLIKGAKAGIPVAWLENINRKSASYAKQQAHVITEYKQANGITDNIVITPRERDILNDLSHGLTRAEMASSRGLSINTVKMVINHLYDKIGAENLPDAIHIATEKKMI